jgi:AMP nucleosidase
MKLKQPLEAFSPFLPLLRGNAQVCQSGEEAVTLLSSLYHDNKVRLSPAVQDLSEGKPLPKHAATYPYVGLKVEPHQLNVDATKAYGLALEPGCYGTTVTRPDLFSTYYKEQLDLLIQHHKIDVFVGESTWPIPLPFIDEASLISLNPAALWDLSNNIPLPDLNKVDDAIANGTYDLSDEAPRPLALFTAERVDYSLHRLHHYCGTDPVHFQNFILLTNYQRYGDYFLEHATNELKEKPGEVELVLPGDFVITDAKDVPEAVRTCAASHLPQMPAYHLKHKDKSGITFVNIGVGPTNARNITDHLAVLRPNCWIMLGHCAGFRRSQHLGDYVLAHGYARDDHVLDHDVPLWTPIPPIAEMQIALSEAVIRVTGLKGHDIKTRMRTGTVVSTDNRNWELSPKELFTRYDRTRAIALDLESASLATNGFRFRVPYGTLLCVSDKPLHGELKLKGMATQFYKDRVRQHLEIGLEAVRILRKEGAELLHSRKLRGFDEPPFR